MKTLKPITKRKLDAIIRRAKREADNIIASTAHVRKEFAERNMPRCQWGCAGSIPCGAVATHQSKTITVCETHLAMAVAPETFVPIESDAKATARKLVDKWLDRAELNHSMVWIKAAKELQTAFNLK